MKIPEVGNFVQVEHKDKTMNLIVKEIVEENRGRCLIRLHSDGKTFQKGDTCHWVTEKGMIKTIVLEVSQGGLILLSALPGS